MSLGDFDVATVVYGKFTTFRPSTGAPFTLAGTPALSVYKDGSTTQSTTGVTLTTDFDAVTGLNGFAIDTSADGSFYSAGSFFDIVITTGTVDAVSAVGTVVGRFSLQKNSALKHTAVMTESYAADGSAPSAEQMLFMIWSFLSEKNVASTTLTTKKLDGATTSMTFALNSATVPTAITRAT